MTRLNKLRAASVGANDTGHQEDDLEKVRFVRHQAIFTNAEIHELGQFVLVELSSQLPKPQNDLKPRGITLTLNLLGFYRVL